MKKAISICSLAALFFPATMAVAANLGFEENYILPPSKVLTGNAYILGSTVYISGIVTDDLTIAGGDVSLSGTVGKEVTAAGGNIQSVADVGDDFRAVGARIVVTKTIANDLVLAGGTINILPEAAIGGDAYFFGWRIAAAGNYAKNLYLAGNEITIDGKITGNVKIFSAGSITIGKDAEISGNVTYSSEREAKIIPGARIDGKMIHQYSAPAITASSIRGFAAGIVGVAFLLRLVVTLALALFFVLVFRKLSIGLVKESVNRFGKTFLVGLIVVIAVPISGLILIASIAGSLIGIIVLSIFFALAILALALSGVIFGQLCMKYLFKKDFPPVIDVWTAVLGVLVIGVLSLVPVVGPLISFVFIINALGGLSNLFYRQFFASRK